MSACVICGRQACDLHHLTGTDAGSRYLDPELVAPLCHDDHELVHDDWHTRELHETRPGLSRLERIELGLRRLAVAAARFAEAHPEGGWASSCARTLSRWAEELGAELRARDVRDPGWRQDPSFYPSADCS
jgi:hypothetical protein